MSAGHRPVVPTILMQETSMRGHEVQDDGTFRRDGAIYHLWTCVSDECNASLFHNGGTWNGSALVRCCRAVPVTRNREQRGNES